MSDALTAQIKPHALACADGSMVLPIKIVANILKCSSQRIRTHIQSGGVTTPRALNGIRSYYLTSDNLHRLAAMQSNIEQRRAYNVLAASLHSLCTTLPDGFYAAQAEHWLNQVGLKLDDLILGFEGNPMRPIATCVHEYLLELKADGMLDAKYDAYFPVHIPDTQPLPHEYCVRDEKGRMLSHYITVAKVAASPALADWRDGLFKAFKLDTLCRLWGMARGEFVRDAQRRRRLDYHRSRSYKINDWKAGNWVLTRTYNKVPADAKTKPDHYVLTARDTLAYLKETMPTVPSISHIQMVRGLCAITLAYDPEVDKKDRDYFIEAFADLDATLCRLEGKVLSDKASETAKPAPIITADGDELYVQPSVEQHIRSQVIGTVPFGTHFLTIRNPKRKMYLEYFKLVGSALYKYQPSPTGDSWVLSDLQTVERLRRSYKQVMDVR